MTTSHIFKNLNLIKKGDRNFHGNSLKTILGTKNYIQILQVDWLEGVVIWTPLERQKIEVHIFERPNLSCFDIWKFTTKEI